VIVPSGLSVAVPPLTGTVSPGTTELPLISVTINGLPSGSVSLVKGLIITGVLGIVDTISLFAIGSVFTTVISTIAVSVAPNSSTILYGNVTTHANPVFGTKVIIPAVSIVTTHPLTGILCATPGVTVTPLIEVIVRSSPSGLTSLLRRLRTTGLLLGMV